METHDYAAYQQGKASDIIYPTKRAEIEFCKPIRVGDRVTIEITPELGNTSVTFRAKGRSDSQTVLEAAITMVFVNDEDMEPVPIPDEVRSGIDRYSEGEAQNDYATATRRKTVMDETARDKLIDGYFDGMDQSDHDLLHKVLAGDIVYEHPVSTAHGLEDTLALLNDERPPQESVHEVSRRIHVRDASVAEGRKIGTVEGDPVDLPFCDVFKFDATESAISEIAVYVRE